MMGPCHRAPAGAMTWRECTGADTDASARAMRAGTKPVARSHEQQPTNGGTTRCAAHDAPVLAGQPRSRESGRHAPARCSTALSPPPRRRSSAIGVSQAPTGASSAAGDGSSYAGAAPRHLACPTNPRAALTTARKARVPALKRSQPPELGRAPVWPAALAPLRGLHLHRPPQQLCGGRRRHCSGRRAARALLGGQPAARLHRPAGRRRHWCARLVSACAPACALGRPWGLGCSSVQQRQGAAVVAAAAAAAAQRRRWRGPPCRRAWRSTWRRWWWCRPTRRRPRPCCRTCGRW